MSAFHTKIFWKVDGKAHSLTGSNRTTRAQAEGVITLREEEDVIYAAQFYDCGWDCGLTENDLLMKNFQTIQTSWYS